MNNSKKTIKGPQQTKKQHKISNPKIWIVTSIVLITILIGAVLFDQLYKRVILTIDEDKYYLEDLSYYIYGTEANYDYLNQYFGYSWDMVYDESTGATLGEVAKQEAISNAIYNEILYREAKANNYSLTDEESESISTDIDAMLTDEANKDLIRKNNFTKKYLTNILGKTTLAARYRQDVIDSFDIDDEGIKAGYDFEDYRQYDIEYLFISTQTTDEEGNSVDLEEDEKASAYNKINAIYDTAVTTEDWSTLVPEEEEELKYAENSFVDSADKFDQDFETMMMGMENGEVSEIYEDKSGYYLVRMVDNESTATYDSTVEKAITQAEDDAFTEEYQKIQENYNYEINDNALKQLTMGEITLPN